MRRRPRTTSLVGASAGLIFTVGAACAVFDGDRADAMEPYLSGTSAIRFCSQALDCPLLNLSIALSTGVPVALDYSQCMTWAAGIAPDDDRDALDARRRVLDCIASAAPRDCAAAERCLSFVAVLEAHGCSPGVTCMDDGGTARVCTDGGVIVDHHCGSAAFPLSACLESDAGARGCAVADGECPPPRCRGSILYACTAGLLEAFDCAVGGQTCGVDPTLGHATCLSEGRERRTGEEDALGFGRCDGDVLETSNSRYLSRFPCAKFGLACAGGASPICTPPSAECAPGDDAFDRCASPGVVHACVAGKAVDIDCAAAGLECHPPNVAAKVRAHCGPIGGHPGRSPFSSAADASAEASDGDAAAPPH
jgi:hypothetical protein